VAIAADPQEVYRGFGIDRTDYSGDAAWELPLATWLIVDRGVVSRVSS